MSVEKANVVLLVFKMPGCPACQDFVPRLYKQIEGFQEFGHRFVFYEDGMVTKYGEIPVITVDVTSQHPSVVELADQHRIHALPTTIVLPRWGAPSRYEGALSDRGAYEVLMETLRYR